MAPEFGSQGGKLSPSKDPLVGQLVGGRYEIVRRIGKGGMGAIYEVRNTRLGGRAFALKTLTGDAAEDPETLARFRREADVISKLKHPNVVDVIDWEVLADGSPCLVMEYLQGEDLCTRIRVEAPLPWPFIARVGDQILSALSVAHAAGVIHRDLKPQNVYLSVDDSGEERAKLLDFGVSKIRDSRSLATTDARLIGTPSYMAPEQAEGQHELIGPPTDLWAMGAILHEMATGQLAFDGESLPQILFKICSREPAPVNQRRADAPAAFVELVKHALVRDVSARVGDADVMRVRLREALREVAVGVSYPELVRRPTTSKTRKATGADALGDTVASGDTPHVPGGAAARAQLGTSTTMNSTAGEVLARPRRWAPWLIGGSIAAVGAVVAVAMIPPPPARTTPPPAAAPIAAPPAPAPAVAAPDAAPARTMVAPDAAPAPAPAAAKATPERRPLRRPPRPVAPAGSAAASQEPKPKQDPKKQPCDPDDTLCWAGEDR